MNRAFARLDVCTVCCTGRCGSASGRHHLSETYGGFVAKLILQGNCIRGKMAGWYRSADCQLTPHTALCVQGPQSAAKPCGSREHNGEWDGVIAVSPLQLTNTVGGMLLQGLWSSVTLTHGPDLFAENRSSTGCSRNNEQTRTLSKLQYSSHLCSQHCRSRTEAVAVHLLQLL
jgi:hypothetical protein